MPNETRPRRETSGTSRIRKTSSTPSAAAPPEDADATAAGAASPLTFGAGLPDSPSPALTEPTRDRKDREPFREEAPGRPRADPLPARARRARARPRARA